ncbi:MAG: hypothetical protein M1495_00495 [Bacteroidetes bacterium]|nr:hypothetical protein [Bacteroidota bacterium]
MFDAVTAVFKENSQIVSTFAMLNTLCTEFQSYVEDIRKRDGEIKTLFAGKTNAKDEAKDELIEKLVPLANSLYVYAKRNGNEEIKSVAYVNKTILLKLRENDLLIKANNIRDYLIANKSSLGDYLVTDEKIAGLTSLISEFQKSADERDSSFANRVSARESLDRLFDKAGDLLNNELDGLMETFKSENSDFYNAYQSARVIKDLGLRKGTKTSDANPTPTPAT